MTSKLEERAKARMKLHECSYKKRECSYDEYYICIAHQDPEVLYMDGALETMDLLLQMIDPKDELEWIKKDDLIKAIEELRK